MHNLFVPMVKGLLRGFKKNLKRFVLSISNTLNMHQNINPYFSQNIYAAYFLEFLYTTLFWKFHDCYIFSNYFSAYPNHLIQNILSIYFNSLYFFALWT